MSRRATHQVIRYGLLAVMLLLGRSALVAHDEIHWQPKLSGHVCELCLHHVGQNEIAGDSSSFVPEHPAPPRLQVAGVAIVCLAPRRRCRIRGPPTPFD